ncbi:NAD(P)/FAD-dependent oxidoreductase [Phenylobacterium ferrooxidans]|uniref:NAD(P)-binding protein n=1 Tax=Phenylobacterium ferrooxidans TaxID=2982689 RepID=A0ABW6CR15_9CAUL
MGETVDCAIIGGGPAGLVAALYLVRFRRTVLIADKGSGRAALIPRSHNYPGFPDGVTGEDLLARLHAQVRRYGNPIQRGAA